jgi:cyclohexanone monooxygenase
VRTEWNPRIAIIGAGAGGLLMAIQLKKAGIQDFSIFEKSTDIGGTWRDNTYPGAACDIPSHLYSYSFELNAKWTRPYGTQPELLEYFKHCANKYGILAHVQCNMGINEARWIQRSAIWRLTADDGSEHEADLVVSALGMLNVPLYPDIPGLDTFGGETFHSSRWNHSVALEGKRIGTIGTGASSVQFSPKVAESADRLHVFQRSPVWVMPKIDAEFTADQKRKFARLGRTRIHRWQTFLRFERMTSFRMDDARMGQRQAHALAHLERAIPDAPLRARLTPDFPVGCKRIVISNDYLPMFNRPNVELVSSPIQAIEPEGVITADGERRGLDVLILATGFRASEFLGAVDFYGVDGRRLRDEWNEGAEAYLGMTVHGYPNLFMLYGPNTNHSGNSIIFILEAQARYVLAAIRRLRRRGGGHLEVKEEVQETYNRQLQEAMDGTVWNGGCTSYFQGPSGKITTQFPHPVRRYWAWTRHFRSRDFSFAAQIDPAPGNRDRSRPEIEV